jgi:hypothetical protein
VHIMSMKNLSRSPSGLESASGEPRPVVSRPAPVIEPPPAEKTANARTGKIHLGAWVGTDYGKSLMLVQVKTGRKKHELIREAYNDLFAKYDVPVIDEA